MVVIESWEGRNVSMTSQVSTGEMAAGLTAGPGRGPGGQLLAALRPAGHCPAPGCGNQISLSRLMCRVHWYQIPRQLRDRVWATWRSGEGVLTAEQCDAVLTAIGVLSPGKNAA